MRNEPVLTDFVPVPSISDAEIWHAKALQEDIINIECASKFYDQFGKLLSEGVKEFFKSGKPISDLIEEISELASSMPATDWESQQKPINITSEKDVLNWRKEVYWRKNVRYITESIISRSKELYDQKKKEYEEYRMWYDTLTDEEKKHQDLLDDFGL